jgi:hypothetical protein
MGYSSSWVLGQAEWPVGPKWNVLSLKGVPALRP